MSEFGIGLWEIWIKFKISVFQTNICESWVRYILWKFPQINDTWHYRWKVNIGSGNGLVPAGNKPLPEPMLTQNDVAIWRP